jgi:hypothetical protein
MHVNVVSVMLQSLYTLYPIGTKLVGPWVTTGTDVVVKHHAMKTYRGIWVQLHAFITSTLNEDKFLNQALASLTRSPDTTGQEGGWAPGSVWTLRIKL